VNDEARPDDVLHPAYFETCFRLEPGMNQVAWPAKFAIVSAYATTGEQWPESRNFAADRELEAALRTCSTWLQRIVGYSPTSGHAEPSWAVDVSFEAACDFGLRFLQHAIYFVAGDDLCVSFCDARRKPVQVGSFRERLRDRDG
jgi:peptidoglycan/xylan/chitin deacetylase (PgdA/CDA1 family)